MAKIYGVTTQEMQSNDKRIGIIKENVDGNFQYSTDGLTFKTVSGGGSTGAKGFDFVVAPADSGITNADLVLTGTDDQIALNKFFDNLSKGSVVKFLSGTIELSDSFDISKSCLLIGSGDVNFSLDTSGAGKIDTIAGTVFNFTTTSARINCRRDPCIFQGFKFSCELTSTDSRMSFVDNCYLKDCDCYFALTGNIPSSEGAFKNVNFDNCIIRGAFSLSSGSLINNTGSIPSIIVRNTYFDIKNNAGGNTILSNRIILDNCTFNNNYDYIINYGNGSAIIRNCTAMIPRGQRLKLIGDNGTSSIINSSLCGLSGSVTQIRNCEFTYNITLQNCNRIESCNFNNCQITFENSDNNCIFDSCIFHNSAINNVYSCINCVFTIPIYSISTFIANEFINCKFIAAGEISVETLVKSNFIDNCEFSNITTTVATNGLIQAKDSNSISAISNCTFDGITFIPNEEGMYNYSIVNGFTVVNDCSFQKISITKNDSDSKFISNVKSVRGIYVGENITGNHIVIFDGSQESISNVQTFASSKNLSFLSTPGMAADGFKITLSNIYMKYGLDMYFLGDYAKIDGLTVDHYEVDNDHDKLINVFSVNSNDKHFEFSNMSIDMSSGMTNLASKLINLTVGSSKLFLKLSNIYWKNNGLSHPVGTSGSFPSNVLVDTDDFTPEVNQPGKYQVICDNITIIDNGGVAITNKKLSAYLNDKLSQFLMYSNYTISGYNPDIPVTTVNNTLNYSSNAAVKYENGKPYMYTGTDWVELQLKS